MPDTSRVDAIQQRLNAIDHAITNDERADLRKLEAERQDLAAELAALRAEPDDHEARRRVHRTGIQQARTALAGEAEAHITGLTDDRMHSVAGLLRQAYAELKAADQERLRSPLNWASPSRTTSDSSPSRVWSKRCGAWRAIGARRLRRMAGRSSCACPDHLEESRN